MKSTTLLSVLFVVCLFLIFQAPLPALCSNLYESLCTEAKEDANSCLSLLKADSKITEAKNYLDLSKEILEMAIDKGTQARNYFIKLSNDHPTQAIKQCGTEFYYNSIQSFRNSLSDLIKNPQNANSEAKDAAVGPENCQRAIEKEGSKNSTAISLNNETLLISKIAFLSTNHLLRVVVDSY